MCPSSVYGFWLPLCYRQPFLTLKSYIGGVTATVLASSVVGRGLSTDQVKLKDYTNGICCFSAKRTALGSKSKDGLCQNQEKLQFNKLISSEFVSIATI